MDNNYCGQYWMTYLVTKLFYNSVTFENIVLYESKITSWNVNEIWKLVWNIIIGYWFQEEKAGKRKRNNC